jgi:pectate lyase
MHPKPWNLAIHQDCMGMKKLTQISGGAILFSMLLIGCSKDNDTTTPPPDPSPNPVNAATGFATQNGGTTGGNNGNVVTVTNFNQLRTYLTTPGAFVVKFNQRIYNGEKGGSINITSNKTLLGEGPDAFLDGIGLTISNVSNIIVRNVKFTLNSVTNRDDPSVYSPTGDEGRPQILVNGGDLIRIQGSSNIWVDHCEFFNEDPTVQTNQDLYDGCIDITGNSAFITISWNKFRDAHKTHLVGSSDNDNFDRRITFHHNYYDNVRQRLPSYRFGTGHVVNNFFSRIGSTGINTRMGACVRVENNIFENARSPLIRDGSPLGNFQLIGNIFTGTTGITPPTESNCTANLPYTFNADPATEVKAKVMAGAGVGKIQ